MKRIFILFSCLTGLYGYAHKPSDSYLELKQNSKGWIGRWDISVRDLNQLLPLDANQDQQISWGELKKKLPELKIIVKDNLKVTAPEGACELDARDPQIDTHSDGQYLSLLLDIQCPSVTENLRVEYSLLFQSDALHRGLANIETEKKTFDWVFENEKRTLTIGKPNPQPGRLHLFLLAGILVFAAVVYQRKTRVKKI